MYNVKTPRLPTLVAKEARIISKLQQLTGVLCLGSAECRCGWAWIRRLLIITVSHIDLASET
jgi:hypothetical protein